MLLRHPSKPLPHPAALGPPKSVDQHLDGGHHNLGHLVVEACDERVLQPQSGAHHEKLVKLQMPADIHA